MSYPLIILGAGASFDCVPEIRHASKERFRPPLTKNLFDKQFEDIINKYSEVKDLASSILASLRGGDNFEKILSDIKEKSQKNPDRLKQLVDFEMYLQELFKQISNEFGNQTGSNYGALIQEINDGFKRACIVNFNYDLLLEEALKEKITEDLNSYIDSTIKIIKIHGSCDWVYSIYDLFNDIKDPRKFLLENPLFTEQRRKEKTQRICRKKDYVVSNGAGKKFLYCPAIAIPLYGKDGFVCPKSHIDALEGALAQVDRILIIGWAANDQCLIDLIKDKIKRPIGITTVAGNESEINDIFGKFSESNFKRAAGFVGFSNFMGSKECKTFFGTA